MYNTSVTKGTQESHGRIFKSWERLMSQDELAVMDGGKWSAAAARCAPFPLGSTTSPAPQLQVHRRRDPKNAFDTRNLYLKKPMRPGELYRNYEVTAEDLEAPAI